MPKTWLITGLLAAGSIAYVVFIFLPLQKSIDGLRGQVHERRQQIMQAHEVSRLWKSDAPRQAQLITHYASLTQQADQAGIHMDRLDPLPVVELNLIALQNVTMQFHGPFAAVFDLLLRLEALPGTIWVRDLKLHANNETDNTLRGELTLTIFVDRADYAN